MAQVNESDERYQAVEDAIVGAFLQLSRTKEPQTVTVAEIIRRAGIVRSTFYNHYEDMPSLISHMQDMTISHIFEMMEDFRPKGNTQITRSFFMSLCRYAMENSFLSAMLRSPLAPDFIRKILNMFHEYVRGVMQGQDPDLPENSRMSFAIAFSIGGVIGSLHKWTVDEFREPPEQVADTLTELFTGGVLRCLH